MLIALILHIPVTVLAYLGVGDHFNQAIGQLLLLVLIVNGLSSVWLGSAMALTFQRQEQTALFYCVFQSIVLNGLSILALWSQQFLIAFILIAYTCQQMINAMKIVSRQRNLRKLRWTIKYPIGWYSGVSLILFHFIFLIYCQAAGIILNFNWIWVSLVVLVGVSLYFYVQYGNEKLHLPPLFYSGVVGYLLYSFNLVFWQHMLIWGIMVLSVGLYVYFVYLQSKQNQDKKFEKK